MNQIYQTFFTTESLPIWEPWRKVQPNRNTLAGRFAAWICNFLIARFDLGEKSEKQIRTFHEVTIDRQKIGNAVMEHLHQFCREQGEYPELILMGRDYYRELIGEIGHQQLTFTASARYHIRSRYGAVEYNGVTVALVPWMNGMIALPKLNITNEKN